MDIINKKIYGDNEDIFYVTVRDYGIVGLESKYEPDLKVKKHYKSWLLNYE